MLPGSLDPKPLPPLKNPRRAVNTGQRTVRAQIDTDFPGRRARSAAISTAASPAPSRSRSLVRPGKFMRLSRNRKMGQSAAHSLHRTVLPRTQEKIGWNGLLVGDMSQPRGGQMLFRAHQPSNRPRRGYLVCADAGPHAKPRGARVSARAPIWSRPICAMLIRNCGPKDILRSSERLAQDPVGRPHPGSMPRSRRRCAARPELIIPGFTRCVPWYGHAEHFHVQIACPADSPECKPPAPAAPKRRLWQ